MNQGDQLKVAIFNQNESGCKWGENQIERGLKEYLN